MKTILSFSHLMLLLFNLNACSTKGFQTSSPSSYQGHGGESVSAEILDRYKPGAIAAESAQRIEMMLDIRSPSLGITDNKAHNLYFNWNVTGTHQVWKVSGPQRFPMQMTGGEDQTLVVGITPDGKHLILSRDQLGEENPGLYLQKTSGGPLIKISHKKKVQTLYQYTSKDSRNIYYRANDSSPSSYNIYRYHLPSGTSEMILQLNGYWTIADALDSGVLLLAKWKGNTSSEYYLFDPNSSTDKNPLPLFGHDEEEEYNANFADAKGEELIVLTNRWGEFRTLYRWKKGQFTPLLPPHSYDLSRLQVDPSRTKILFHRNRQGSHSLMVLSLPDFRPLPLPTFSPHVEGPLLQSYWGTTTPNGRYSTVGAVTAKHPTTTFVYDWQQKKLTSWTLPSAPEVDTSKFIVSTWESYPARDGVEIPMLVYRPPQCQNPDMTPCPVIVNFHGGPESQSQPGFSPTWELFLEQGFVVVLPNVRGSDGYGKSWLHADNGPKRLDVIGDIADCGAFIKSHWAQGGISPKIGIMGGSYGGYLALLGMSQYAGIYQAGVAVVGMSNLLTFLQQTAPYRRVLRISEYGDPIEDQEALLKLSPITYIQQIRDPLLIIHGVSDPRVPAGEAIQIQRELEKKSIPAQLILFGDEGHGIKKRANRVLSLGHTLDFFKKHLSSKR